MLGVELGPVAHQAVALCVEHELLGERVGGQHLVERSDDRAASGAHHEVEHFLLLTHFVSEQCCPMDEHLLVAGFAGVSASESGIGAGMNNLMNCHGFGMCGTCRVQVVKGMENTNPMTVREKIKFLTPIPTPIPDPLPCMAFIGSEETMRLACMTTVQGDIEVETGPELNLFGDNFFS